MCYYRLYRFGCHHGPRYTTTQTCTQLEAHPVGLFIEPSNFCPLGSVPEPAVFTGIPCWRCHCNFPGRGVDIEAYKAVVVALASDNEFNLSAEHKLYHARLLDELPAPVDGTSKDVYTAEPMQAGHIEEFPSEGTTVWTRNDSQKAFPYLPQMPQLMHEPSVLPPFSHINPWATDIAATQNLVYAGLTDRPLQMLNFQTVPVQNVQNAPTFQNGGDSGLVDPTPCLLPDLSSSPVQLVSSVMGSPLDFLLNQQTIGSPTASGGQPPMLPKYPNQSARFGADSTGPLPDLFANTGAIGYFGSSDGQPPMLGNTGESFLSGGGMYQDAVMKRGVSEVEQAEGVEAEGLQVTKKRLRGGK